MILLSFDESLHVCFTTLMNRFSVAASPKLSQQYYYLTILLSQQSQQSQQSQRNFKKYIYKGEKKLKNFFTNENKK